MDIRTLKLFHHLAGSLHFSRTSQVCNISPSALTRVIQRIEIDVGKQLLIRGNRCVELTYAGQVLKKYAEDVLGRGRLQHRAQVNLQRIVHGEQRRENRRQHDHRKDDDIGPIVQLGHGVTSNLIEISV